MKILVYGCGVIGSLLVHTLCKAGNDVTVVSKGAWGDVLRENGLRIHHQLQRKDITIMTVSWNTRYIPVPMLSCLNIIIFGNSARRSAIMTCVCACCIGVQNSYDIPTRLTAITATTS